MKTLRFENPGFKKVGTGVGFEKHCVLKILEILGLKNSFALVRRLVKTPKKTITADHMWTSFFGACEFTSRGPESGPPAVRVRRSEGVQKTSKGLKRRSCQNANTQVSCLIRVSTGINARYDSGLQTLRYTLAGPDKGLQALCCTVHSR